MSNVTHITRSVLPFQRPAMASKRLYPVKCPAGHMVVMVDTPGVTVSRTSCPDRGCQMRVEVTVRQASLVD